MAWDERLATMVLVVPGPSAAAPQPETWIWTGTRWSRAHEGDFPRTSLSAPSPLTRSVIHFSGWVPLRDRHVIQRGHTPVGRGRLAPRLHEPHTALDRRWACIGPVEHQTPSHL